ncbi:MULTISPECIES: ATP synthase F0 subunit B [Bacillaceae]|uniref:ATP synthase F0 subunit B n=1 Tax=Bacillaceae TaxID=186817 RepID=UPI00118D1E71|nr:ATP synthase F0 subunit B [Bacillus sp. S3]QCJ41634.1 ATP synthase F0 subunit B [Bacillus sp. S3]
MGDLTLFGLPISLGTMVYQAIIFTVLVFILKRFVFKKLVDILDKRKEHIENQLELTEKYKFDAKINLQASEDILKKAKIEAREILQRSEKEAMQIIQDAKEEVRKIKKEENEDAFLSPSHSYPRNTQIRGA